MTSMQNLVEELRRPLPRAGAGAKEELKQFQILFGAALLDRSHPLHNQAVARSHALASLLPDTPEVLGAFLPGSSLDGGTIDETGMIHYSGGGSMLK